MTAALATLPGRPHRPRRFRWEPVVFALLVAGSLLPVAAYRHVVSIDGPSHVLGGYVLAHYGEPVVSHYYRIDWFPTPNLGTELLLAGLTRVASTVVAERLLVGGCIVFLAYAVRYAVLSASRRAAWLSYAGLPLLYHHLLFYGFYNYSYGLAAALVVVGYSLRHACDFRRRHAVVLALLLLLTYFLHLLPLLMALLFVVVVIVTELRRLARESPRRTRAELARAAALPAAALAPVVVLTGLYLTRPDPEPLNPTWVAFLTKIKSLATLRVMMFTLTRWDRVVADVFALTLALLALLAWRRYRRRRVPAARPAAVAALVSLAVYLAVPDFLNGAYGFLDARISFFPVLFLLLWLAPHALPGRARLAAAVTFGVLAATLVVVRLPAIAHYNRDIADATSVVSAMAPHSTVATVRLSGFGRRGTPWHGSIDPLRHIGSLIAAEDGGVDLAQFEAQLPYFPAQFRRPYLFLTRTGYPFTVAQAVPPVTTLLSGTPDRYDDVKYVVVIGAARARPATLRLPAVQAMYQALDAYYTLIRTSRPLGLAQLYVHR